VLLCLMSFAHAPPARAAGDTPTMSAQERRQMVDDIAKAVVNKLGRADVTRPAAVPRSPADMGGKMPLMQSGNRAVAGVLATAAAVADLGRQVVALHRGLAEERPRGLLPPGLLLFGVIAVCLCVEKLALLAAANRRRRIAAEAAGLRRGVRLFATDLAGLAMFAVAAMVFARLGFAGPSLLARTGIVVLDAALVWRIYMLPVETVLRPHLPGARLVGLADGAARRAKATVSALLLAAWVMMGAARHLWGIDGILCVSGALTCFALALLRLRRVVGEVILGRFRTDPAGTGIVRTCLARYWYALAVVVLLLLYAAFLVGAFLGELAYVEALVRTLETLLLLWGIEALCAKGLRDLRRRMEASGEDLVAPLIGLRILRALARTGVLTMLTYVWLVHTMLPIAGFGMQNFGHSIMLAGVTVFATYVLWEALRTVIERHLGAAVPRPGDAEAEDAAGRPRSRLATILPLLRVGLAAGLFTVTGLVVASQLGIDTAPLIAGAGVLGLAISFGSQALVRDIVSGIFFIADDAFRVGEYVDTGRLKGTVEGMTMRSLRLRHQNGQLHTIPFGQLGAVTNFSRDWATVKFNLRLARDTDLERLRRTVKRLGLELMRDPELAPQIIEPLKLQGLAEVADSAMVVRLKFTALPANASWVQRTYLGHLYERLPAEGIEFVSNVVAVQTVGASPGNGPQPAAAGAAATLSVVPPPQTEAAAF
jgi:small-conductance mechanosensitive channel